MNARELAKKQAKEEALEMLHKIVKEGDTVYTVLRHVSDSGMMRRIDVYAIDKETNRLAFLTGYVAKAIDYTHDHRKGGLIVKGCGMDMAWHVIDSLHYAMGIKLHQESI